MTQPDQKCECACHNYRCTGCYCPSSQPAKPEPDEMDNCICSEYDRKGKSTCGFDCPVHKKAQPEAESWEQFESFCDTLTVAMQEDNGRPDCKNCGTDWQEMKARIKSLLGKERKRILKALPAEIIWKDFIQVGDRCEGVGFNDCLEQVKKLLNSPPL